ncbi:alpha/beta hydrolase [Chitinasiproducens palmae]|uniref:Acetyl esterase/lipase n=1 Tax=Chitinasiproducens palmae TaxID=1770053 RepID=A0A1H2PK36_9BURK|nr:alpha/beta hydrolase [Chitinasiproducens palmae]SDV46248.1 Acetyl esterase/lipase [Chitinasiproducens palmae]
MRTKSAERCTDHQAAPILEAARDSRSARLPVRVGAAGAVLAASAAFLLSACNTPPDKPSPVANAVAKASAQVRADQDMLTVLNAFQALDPKAIEKLTPAEARQQPTIADAVNSVLRQQGRDTSPTALVPGVTSRDITVQGAAGGLAARVFTPAGKGPFPIVVYFHGGGWVIADRNVYDAGARGLAKQANAIVVSVDYRRAPEAKFPAAWDDAFASYKWVVAHANVLGGDPKRIALAGESAGGNLAVATAIAARDANVTKPLAVVSVYPVAQTGSLNTPSYIENATAKPLNRPMIEWFVANLIRTPADKQDPRLDLVHAQLAGLPPVTIINATIDPLRDDGAQLANALQSAGVPVERKVYTGVTHEFFGTAAVVQKAQDAQQYAGQRLGQAFGQTAQR